jgi:protein SCO1/2
VAPVEPKPQIEEPGGAAAWLFGLWVGVSLIWGGLALATPGPGSAWLLSAQAVCFGTLTDGLPSPWGWAVLFLAPLSLLSGLVVAYQAEFEAWMGSRRNRTSVIVLLVVAALFAAEAFGMARKVQKASAQRFAIGQTTVEPMPADYPRVARELPAFRLTDQRGRSVDAASLRGQVHVLTFAYAHCATVCPFLVRDALKAVRATPGVGAVFLTLDPWRDTVSALPSLAQRWGMGAESQLLSGPPAAVLALLQGLGIPYQRDEKTGMVDHPPLIYVLDAQGKVVYQLSHPSPAWIEEALRRVQKAG